MTADTWSRRRVLRTAGASLAAASAGSLAASSPPAPTAAPVVAIPGLRYRTVTSQGIRIVVGEAGPPDAPGVMLVHGGLVAHDWWRAQVAVLLAAGYRVITPDMPGHGGSDPMMESRANPYLVDSRVLADLLDDTGPDRPLLVGWAAGALRILRGLGPGNPLESRAGAVLVVGGFARHATAAHHLVVFPTLVSAMAGHPARFVDTCLRPDLETVPGDTYRQLLRSTTPDVVTLARLIAAATTIDLSHALGRTQVPITVAHGADDQVVRRTGAHDLATLARTRLHLLPGGHATFLTRPDEFTSLLLDTARSIH